MKRQESVRIIFFYLKYVVAEHLSFIISFVMIMNFQLKLVSM